MADEKTVHHVGGRRVEITTAQKKQHDKLLDELHKALADRALSEVPLDKEDPYNKAKEAFDNFVASL